MPITNVTAIQDVFVSSTYPDTNFYSQDGEVLYVGSFKNSSDVFRSLLQFNMCETGHAIPIGSTIQSAYLILYLYRNDNVGTANVNGFKLLDTYDQYFVTYNNVPKSSFPTSSVVGGAVTPSGSTGAVTLNVTELVKAWYDGSCSNLGIELRGIENASDNILGFRGTRYPDSTYWPALQVTWAKGTESNTVTDVFDYNDALPSTSTPMHMTGQDQVSFIVTNNVTGGTAPTLEGQVEISMDGTTYFADYVYHFTGLAVGASEVINYSSTAADYVRVKITAVTGTPTGGTYTVLGKTKAG